MGNTNLDVERLVDQAGRLAPVLDLLGSTKNQLGARLADAEGAHAAVSLARRLRDYFGRFDTKSF